MSAPQIKGKGHEDTTCMTILGLQNLLLIQDSKVAEGFRSEVLDTLSKVLTTSSAVKCTPFPRATFPCLT